MKNQILFGIFTLLTVTLMANETTKKSENKNSMVIISTSLGDMKVKLYDETPLHRDNFIKLAKEGFYDGLLFHRVIQGFMVQGGDPNSKNAQPDRKSTRLNSSRVRISYAVFCLKKKKAQPRRRLRRRSVRPARSSPATPQPSPRAPPTATRSAARP